MTKTLGNVIEDSLYLKTFIDESGATYIVMSLDQDKKELTVAYSPGHRVTIMPISRCLGHRIVKSNRSEDDLTR